MRTILFLISQFPIFQGVSNGSISFLGVYVAFVLVPAFNPVVSATVALIYSLVLLPIFLFGVKYSPFSILSSELNAVINFVKAKSTVFGKITTFSKSSSSSSPL